MKKLVLGTIAVIAVATPAVACANKLLERPWRVGCFS
jgi:hypothetical protein